MNTRFVAFLAIVAALGAAGFSHPAQAATTLNTCQVITTNGEYILGQNVSSSGTCFSIRNSTVTNLTFDGNGKAISAPNGDAIEVADYGSGAPTHVDIKNVASDTGVRIYGDAVRYVTFEHLHVDGIVDYGGDDVTIKNNIVGEGGISVSNADRDGWYPYRPVVTNNTVTGGSTNVKILFEIVGGSAHPCPTLNALVDHNTFTETRNDTPLEANAVVRIRCAKGTTFTNNTVRSTGTAIGLYMRDESDGGTYSNNTFWTNAEESIRMASGNVDKTFPANNAFTNNIFRSDTGSSNFIQAIAGGNVFRNNLFWANSDWVGGTMTGGFGTIFDHNTFYNALGDCQYMNYGDSVAPDLYTNDIFVCGGKQVFHFDGYAADHLNANHNIYYLIGKATYITGTQTLANWRASTTAAGSGDDANSINTDPLFTNPVQGDFSLQTSSPAKGKATDGTDVGFSVSAAGTTTLPTPTITMVRPTGTYFAHDTMTLVSAVKDAVGGRGIARVNFYINGKLFATDTKAPYGAQLNTRSFRNGTYTIRTEVVGKNGTTAKVDRSILFKNPLQVQLARPNNSVTVKGVVILTPRYIYGGSEIVSVSFYRSKTILISTDTTAPHRVSWDTRKLKNGVYNISIVVRDSVGAIARHTISLRIQN